MKKGSVALLLFLLSLPAIHIFGQEKIYLSSDQVINDGIDFHNKGEYDKALACYRQVSTCDPNYGMACYEMALTLYYVDRYPEAIAKSREAISIGYDQAYLYSLIGSILDEMGKQDEGIELLTTALKKWPYNQNILYNLAVCYLNTDRPLQAEDILVKSILINPYHSRSHLALARTNYMMGRIAQSYLAYSMVLLLNPSVYNISAFEEAISQKPRLKNQEYKYPYPSDADHGKWDMLKDLLQSEFAFRNDFEYEYEYNYTVGRQSLMLFRKLSFDPADTSIYNRLYARLFTSLYQKAGFETYLNYILKNVKNENVNSWSEKNQDKLKAFVSQAQSLINQGRMYRFYYQDELDLKQTQHYNEDGNLVSAGLLSAKKGEIKEGPWLVIGEDGSLSEKGYYRNDRAQGEWLVYWTDGTLKNKLNFVDDVLDGAVQIFHPNGAPDKAYFVKSGNKNGTSESFTHSGFPLNRNNYTDNKTNGPGVYYNYSEGFTRNYNYINDTLEKGATETWLNGKPKLACSYRRGMFDGPFTSWYSNGGKESERTYRNDTLTGRYYEYYPNNPLSREYGYDRSGNLSGKIISYDRNGRTTAVEDEYIDGSLNGTRTEFYPDGSKLRVLTYNKDHLLSILCYDEKGKELYNSKVSDSTIYFKSFYPDGILSAEGLILNGKRQGKWKFYNPLGLLTDESVYSHGQADGTQRTYFENGQVEKEYGASGNYILGGYREYYINGHLKMQGTYDSTGTAGKWLYYYPNDTISSIAFYSKGKLAGRSISYHPDGKLRSEEYFDSDGNSIRSRDFNPDGSVAADLDYRYGKHTFEIKFPNGKLKEKKNISDNVLHGVQETYYPDGTLATRTERLHNLIDGYYRKWDYAGRLAIEIPYVLNKAEGEARWFNDNIPEYTSHHEQDKLQGISTGFHYNGKKAREYTYVDDKKTGNADFYSPEGIFMYRIRYVDNTMKAYSYQDRTGKMIPEKPITDTTVRIVAYYPNGKVSASIALLKGLYHGKFTSYYSTGTLLREETFKFGMNEGYDKTYYPGNKLRELINYTADDKNGLYELYYENGKKEISGNYNMDNENGDWIIYKPDGTVKLRLKYFNGTIYESGPK